jgi:hypothetical protein
MGRYLLGRIATLPVRVVGVTMAIVSPAGCVMQLAVYNFPILPVSCGPATQSDVDAAFPLHAIVAIKEPQLKMAATGTSPLLRVDSPSDIMFLPLGHRLLEGVTWRDVYPKPGTWTPPTRHILDIDGWKVLGNKVRRAMTSQREF